MKIRNPELNKPLLEWVFEQLLCTLSFSLLCGCRLFWLCNFTKGKPVVTSVGQKIAITKGKPVVAKNSSPVTLLMHRQITLLMHRQTDRES